MPLHASHQTRTWFQIITFRTLYRVCREHLITKHEYDRVLRMAQNDLSFFYFFYSHVIFVQPCWGVRGCFLRPGNTGHNLDSGQCVRSCRFAKLLRTQVLLSVTVTVVLQQQHGKTIHLDAYSNNSERNRQCSSVCIFTSFSSFPHDTPYGAVLLFRMVPMHISFSIKDLAIYSVGRSPAKPRCGLLPRFHPDADRFFSHSTKLFGLFWPCFDFCHC